LTTPLRIGIAGLGTVGGGTFRLLTENRALLARRSCRDLVVRALSARDRAKDRGAPIHHAIWYDDARALAVAEDVDVVVEMIGGADGIAREVIEAALRAGKHVVTANKALLAHHGAALARRAEEAGVSLNFEAAVGGGIPIVKALREGLAANRIKQIFGILNGTCNFVLTGMERTGAGLAEVLREAQRLGYAEADPTFDIGGVDTAHKLAILASLAFNVIVTPADIHVEGIEHISALDIRLAHELGYRIKLLGIAGRPDPDDEIELRVHPCMVARSTPIADVSGVLNAVVVEGDFVGQAMFEGAGAGARATASAVVADLVDIARGLRVPTFGLAAKDLKPGVPASMDRRAGAYYVRLTVLDRPGVLAAVAAALATEDVSIDSLLQRGRAPGEAVTVVMTTHETREAAMIRALAAISTLDTVVEEPRMIRIEQPQTQEA
jgi:homoserine dehydrogenase